MSLYHAAFFLALTLTLAAPTSHKQSHTQPDLQLRGNHLHKFLQRASSIASSKLLEGNSSPLTDVLTLPASERQSGGFTGDPCQSGDECRGTRNCLTATDEVPQLCEPGDICICFQLSICSSNADCEEGERCFEFNVPSAGTAQVCVSNTYQDTQTSGNNPVCIATHSLRHIPKEHLVFENDILANVLCDSNDSCATAGHMILYQGTPMMMRSYCDLVGCVNKIMKVNSPRYRRAVTVPSQSEHMEFTLFAARYETQAEEGFLSVAVKLGF